MLPPLEASLQVVSQNDLHLICRIAHDAFLTLKSWLFSCGSYSHTQLSSPLVTVFRYSGLSSAVCNNPDQCQDEIDFVPWKAIWGQILCASPNLALKLHEPSPNWFQPRQQSPPMSNDGPSLSAFPFSTTTSLRHDEGLPEFITLHWCATIIEPVVPDFGLCSTHGIVAKHPMNFANCFCFAVSELLTECDAVALNSVTVSSS